MHKYLLTLLYLSVISAVSAFGYMQDEEIYINLYERVNPAIVTIDGVMKNGFSAGTGCIIDENGTIITGAHVVEKTKDIEVTTSDGKVYKAKVLTKSPHNKDLALIKIEPSVKLQTIKLGDSDDVKIGQKVLTIGNPFGFSGTLTQGIVSRIDYAKGRIQTDAAINPGCSGGPLINTSGEVIGINQAIYNPDNNISNIGIGFAIPINEAKRMLAINNQK
ncbi:trypsin-like peptidase domain-containing protein [bacterium]|nr:trypsin-like peptidase domain-containing protein [bacterium]